MIPLVHLCVAAQLCIIWVRKIKNLHRSKSPAQLSRAFLNHRNKTFIHIIRVSLWPKWCLVTCGLNSDSEKRSVLGRSSFGRLPLGKGRRERERPLDSLQKAGLDNFRPEINSALSIVKTKRRLRVVLSAVSPFSVIAQKMMMPRAGGGR